MPLQFSMFEKRLSGAAGLLPCLSPGGPDGLQEGFQGSLKEGLEHHDNF